MNQRPSHAPGHFHLTATRTSALAVHFIIQRERSPTSTQNTLLTWTAFIRVGNSAPLEYFIRPSSSSALLGLKLAVHLNGALIHWT